MAFRGGNGGIPLQLLFFLPLYLFYIASYSTNIYYWMYFYCTR